MQILRHANNGFYLLLTSDVQEPLREILNLFEGRLKLVAVNQETDAPRVVVEFGDKGEILHVEINECRTPTSSTSHSTDCPRRGKQTATSTGSYAAEGPTREKTQLVCVTTPISGTKITNVQRICVKLG